MTNKPDHKRRFLLLQGPHGPFYDQLGKMLGLTGADVWRVGFNAGDQAFWRDTSSYIPFAGSQDDWPVFFVTILNDKDITDIVIYGDTRSIHADAIKIARQQNLTVHVFEEGYLRPYWITYERGGSNGYSRLMDLGVGEMKTALAGLHQHVPEAPDHWGDMRQHIFYGALYHWFVMFRNRKYPGFRPHRSLTVSQEFLLHLKRLVGMPYRRMRRALATRRIKRGGYPYHIALLQLEHDTSFQVHSPFDTMTDFLRIVIEEFANAAPRHHHLVFKSHPLEDGRTPLRRDIAEISKACHVANRVHFVSGGKLAELLGPAKSAVTVNSTAAQQALWRGLPLKTFGDAVYDKPEFVSTQSMAGFFRDPRRPDPSAYRDYRQFLLETSQVAGGFYSARGRHQLLRQIIDMMLSPDDPYDALKNGGAAPRQQLTLVK